VQFGAKFLRLRGIDERENFREAFPVFLKLAVLARKVDLSRALLL
jgi:hypothetical protein